MLIVFCFGEISRVTYADIRNRVCTDGSEWLTLKMKKLCKQNCWQKSIGYDRIKTRIYMTKISIIIPVYNEIHFIKRTLESVVGQADEIIIGDNASTDGTSDICSDFASRYPEIKYTRHNENYGGKFNWDYVVENARGEYMLHVGGHDMISNGYVKNLLDVMENNPNVTMACPKNIILLNSDYTIKDFCNIGQHGNDILSDSPFVRVESMIKYCYYDSFGYGLLKRNLWLEIDKKYSVFDLGVGWYRGIFAAFYGKIIADDSVNTIFYRMIPGALRETETGTAGETKRIYTKPVDPNSYDFACLCARISLLEEMQTLPNAPLDYAEKLFKFMVRRMTRFYSIPVLENMPGLIPGKKEFAEKVMKDVLLLIGKSPKAPWEKKNTVKKILMYLLPYGIIFPQRVLHSQSPREQYFLYSKTFNIKWLLPFGLVKIIEKFFPPKEAHEASTLYGGAWW